LSWWSQYASQEVGTDKLYDLALREKHLDRVLGDKGERSQRTKLGKALGQMRDKVVEGFRISFGKEDHSGRQRYKLQQVVTPGAAGSEAVQLLPLLPPTRAAAAAGEAGSADGA